MAIVVDFLNNLNLPYRNCKQVYRWRLLNGNCSHVAHNALAEAGIWTPWPTGQFFATAAFNFPVPKNEFVDLLLRTNDLPVENPHALYADEAVAHDPSVRCWLSAAPGGLASAQPAIGENEIYETERLRLIFYETPLETIIGTWPASFASPGISICRQTCAISRRRMKKPERCSRREATERRRGSSRGMNGISIARRGRSERNSPRWPLPAAPAEALT